MTRQSRPVTEVAVGLVYREDGFVLLGQRPVGKPYAGWWEFPGGKFEPGEDAHAALCRELDEELGIEVLETEGWVMREYDYPHAYVRLHFRRVTRWRGAMQAREGQGLSWQPPDRIGVKPVLPAAIEPIRWLGLPQRCAISDATSRGVDAFVARLQRMDFSDPDAPKIVVLREPGLPADELERLFHILRDRLRGGPARLVVSSRHSRQWWSQADGVHLTARDLHAARERPLAERERCLVLASCHCEADLQQAGRIDCDAAAVGPVLPTLSHPGGDTLGWDGFARCVARTPVPCFALGGLGFDALAQARRMGGQGVAAQRAAWPAD